MSTEKAATTIDRETLRRLDRLVKSRRLTNRSRAAQEAVSEKLIAVALTSKPQLAGFPPHA